MSLILGSQSPRRKEIMEYFSLPFTQASSPFDERSVPFTGDPITYVKKLALEKGRALRSSYEKDLILTADTVVYQKDILFNKPIDRAEAISFLQALQGSWHSVFTAVALCAEGIEEVLVEETRQLFIPLTDTQIASYLNSINFLDKAGGYAAQEGGAIITEKLEGSYYNVLGLPLKPLEELLRLGGINLWDHLAT